MGRHEIRLRRHRMTSRRIEGHKNYYDVMRKHQRGSRLKRLLKLVLLFLFFVLLLGIVYFTSRLMTNEEPATIENGQVSMVISDLESLAPQKGDLKVTRKTLTKGLTSRLKARESR
ncbi:MAG: hypothetical protein AAF519_14635 [Bacteroidota bacterium]